MRNITNEINKFIESISDLWKDEPLDGDATENISMRIQLRLDKINGNITEAEFEVLKEEFEATL